MVSLDNHAGPHGACPSGSRRRELGKLVSLVREQARQIANNTACPLVIIDGSPGIGCPVIASITGASHALVVTEPTVSGRHDLERILALTNHFGVPASLCVNKWDLNPDLAKQLAQIALEKGAEPAGRVRYDKAFTAAQIEGRPITETSSDGPVEDIRALWHCLRQRLDDAVAPVEAQSLQP